MFKIDLITNKELLYLSMTIKWTMENIELALNQSHDGSIALSIAPERTKISADVLYAIHGTIEGQRIEICRNSSLKQINDIFLNLTDKYSINYIFAAFFEISSPFLSLLECCTKITKLAISGCTSCFNIKKILLKSHIKHLSLTSTSISCDDLGYILEKGICSLELRKISLVSATEGLIFKGTSNDHSPDKYQPTAEEFSNLVDKFSSSEITSIDFSDSDNKFPEILFSSTNTSLKNLYYTPIRPYRLIIPESMYPLFEKFISKHPNLRDLRTSESIVSRIVAGLLASPELERIELNINSTYSGEKKNNFASLSELIKKTKKIKDFTLIHRISPMALIEGPPYPNVNSLTKIFDAITENDSIELFDCSVHSFDDIIDFIKKVPYTSKSLLKATLRYAYCPRENENLESEIFNTKYNNYQRMIDKLIEEKNYSM